MYTELLPVRTRSPFTTAYCWPSFSMTSEQTSADVGEAVENLLAELRRGAVRGQRRGGNATEQRSNTNESTGKWNVS